MDTVLADDAYIAEPLSEVVAQANRAARIVEIATGILAEQAGERIEALVAYKRARELAALTAKANRAEQDTLAARFCEAAQAEAARFEYLSIDPDAIWTEPGADVAEAKQAETQAARVAIEQAECLESGKRASAGRYNKGCRCEACKHAYTVYRASKRAQG